MEKNYLVKRAGKESSGLLVWKCHDAVAAWYKAMKEAGMENDEDTVWRVFDMDGDLPVMSLEAKGMDVVWLNLQDYAPMWKVTYVPQMCEEKPYMVYRSDGRYIEGEMFGQKQEALQDIYQKIVRKLVRIEKQKEAK